MWVPVGGVICNAPNSRYNQNMISNGSNGTIISWYDNRINPSSNADIYCSRILGEGILTNVFTENHIVDNYKLYQNYPNPFNPSTQICFDLPKSDFVKISVFDMLGREVARLMDGNVNAGSHSVEFNAVQFPSGTYFYKLEAGDFKEMKKMILIK